jgi:hypothetical protein
MEYSVSQVNVYVECGRSPAAFSFTGKTPQPSRTPNPEALYLTYLESTLVEVFILNNLNLFRINTYGKIGGGGCHC